MTENEHGRLGALLIEGLQEALAYERGERSGQRVHRREVAARRAQAEPPPWYAGFQIRDIRQTLSVSQQVFAQMLNVSASTVRAWEQGKREPEGPARRLLQIAESHPEVLMAAVRDPEPRGPGMRPLPRPVAAPRPSRAAADTQARRRP